MDYSISWSYIVKEMEQKFGLKSDSEEKFPFGVLQRFTEKIWNEYFDKLYSEEEKNDT